eukprot:NODE_291_length_1837_cov_308.098993_g234_i0.p1 GENE.NODE_291_length_1837_cov_308.098993_g234_i0~~NODE_291_length_1837_cov_308.098993_g234_i0.p1  ORF type:complete len:522 (-),score=139.95 NODE_291_length_1837_cov_308.098993_g234_i0:191-1756(-)
MDAPMSPRSIAKGMDTEGFRQMYEEKKGCTLTPEDEEFISNLTVKEMVRIWDMFKEEKDWQQEVKKIKKQKQEAKAAAEEQQRIREENAAAQAKADAEAEAQRSADATSAAEPIDVAVQHLDSDDEDPPPPELVGEDTDDEVEPASPTSQNSPTPNPNKDDRTRHSLALAKSPDAFVTLRTVPFPVDWPALLQKRVFGAEPSLHMATHIEKLDHRGTLVLRLLAISSTDFYLFQPDGTPARSFPITAITEIRLSADGYIGLRIPSEYDVVLNPGPVQAGLISDVLQRLYVFLLGKSLPAAQYKDRKEVTGMNRHKPAKWSVVERPCISKTDVLLLKPHACTATSEEELRDDPRTGLHLIRIGRIPGFTNSLFAGDPLLHYVEKVVKWNHKHQRDARILLVSNDCMYLTHFNGKMGRCILIENIGLIGCPPDVAENGKCNILFQVPSEYDCLLEVHTPDRREKLVHVITTIYSCKTAQTLEVTQKLFAEQLDKPKSWKNVVQPILQRSDLLKYLTVEEQNQQ